MKNQTLQNSLTLKFLGGANEVGRSCFLLKSEYKDHTEHFVLDDGFKVENKNPDLPPEPVENRFPLPIKEVLDGAIISHAHLDHSGNFPSRFAEGKRTIGYMTEPTLAVSNILWEDAVKISKNEGNFLGYEGREIKKATENTYTLGYGKQMPISDNLSLEFHNAGHIPGSCMAGLRTNEGKEKSLLYTGDFYAKDTHLLTGAEFPKESFDTLVCETTYGDRDHEPRKDIEKKFTEDVEDVLSSGGTALMAAFAVGRSQELIEVLSKAKLGYQIYLDGMSQKVVRAVLSNSSYLREPSEARKNMKKVKWIKNHRMRRQPLKEPSIVITSAGMLNGGPVLHYLKNTFNDPQSKLYLTGFQVPGTQGHRLMNEGKVMIDEKDYKIRMQYEKYDFSAHAGQSDLKKAVKRVNPERLISVHGDPEAIKSFQAWVKQETGIKAEAPRVGDTIPL